MGGELYHYTDEKSKSAIEASGHVRISQGKDNAKFGDGAYFTKVRPSAGREKILQNNYENRWEEQQYQDRADAYVSRSIFRGEQKYIESRKAPSGKSNQYVLPEKEAHVHTPWKTERMNSVTTPQLGHDECCDAGW